LLPKNALNTLEILTNVISRPFLVTFWDSMQDIRAHLATLASLRQLYNLTCDPGLVQVVSTEFSPHITLIYTVTVFILLKLR